MSDRYLVVVEDERVAILLVGECAEQLQEKTTPQLLNSLRLSNMLACLALKGCTTRPQ